MAKGHHISFSKIIGSWEESLFIDKLVLSQLAQRIAVYRKQYAASCKAVIQTGSIAAVKLSMRRSFNEVISRVSEQLQEEGLPRLPRADITDRVFDAHDIAREAGFNWKSFCMSFDQYSVIWKEIDDLMQLAAFNVKMLDQLDETYKGLALNDKYLRGSDMAGPNRLCATSRRYVFDLVHGLQGRTMVVEEDAPELYRDLPVSEFIDNAGSRLIQEVKVNLWLSHVVGLLHGIELHNRNETPLGSEAVSENAAFEKKLRTEGNLEHNAAHVEQIIASWAHDQLCGFATGVLEGNYYHFRGTMTAPRFQKSNIAMVHNAFLAQSITQKEKDLDLTFWARTQNPFVVLLFMKIFKMVSVSLEGLPFDAMSGQLTSALGQASFKDVARSLGTIVNSDPLRKDFLRLSARNHWEYRHGIVSDSYSDELSITRNSRDTGIPGLANTDAWLVVAKGVKEFDLIP